MLESPSKIHFSPLYIANTTPLHVAVVAVVYPGHISLTIPDLINPSIHSKSPTHLLHSATFLSELFSDSHGSLLQPHLGTMDASLEIIFKY